MSADKTAGGNPSPPHLSPISHHHVRWPRQRLHRSRPRCPSLLPCSWINRGQCMGVHVRQGDYTHTETRTSAHTQPRADSTGIIRNIWDHLQREHELWWDPDALLGFTKIQEPLFTRGHYWLLTQGGVCVCVFLCVYRLVCPDTKWVFGGGSSIFRSDSV